MNNPLVSIIVPIYNAEKYLGKCIDSLVNQTYKNIEIILINDGSTDNSKPIVNKYSYDSRVKIIHQKNSGVSISRNNGIQVAKGKYIQFTDADDWLDNTMIEKMVYSAEKNNSDIVICGYYNIKNDNVKGVYLSNYDLTFKNLISDDSTKYGGFPWNKLIKKDVITNLYDDNIHFYENLLFFLENSKNIKIYSFIKEPLYYYNINDTSAVHSKKYNTKRKTILDALIRIINLVENEYKDYYRYLYISRFNETVVMFNKNNLNIKNKEYYNSFYKDCIKQISIENLSFKNKIKLFILKKCNILYRLYIKLKYFN